MRILAQSEDGQSYAIGDGDPAVDPMTPVQIADMDEGSRFEPVPYATIFKWGYWKDPVNPDDAELISKLLALPEFSVARSAE